MRLTNFTTCAGLALAAAAALPTAAAAQRPGEPTVCSAATAQVTTIAAIDSPNGPRAGDCVTIEGIRVGWELHTNNRSRYIQQPQYNTPSSTGAIIGLAGTPLSGTVSETVPHMVRITGRLETCATRRIRLGVGALVNPTNEQRMAFLSGFCEGTNGLLIDAVEEVILSPAPLTRMIRSGAGPELGNLVPLTDPDLRRFMMQLGAHFGLAVAHRDRAALITLLRPLGETPRTDADAAALADEVLAADSPFAALTPGAEPLIEVFGWREPVWNESEYELRLDPSHPREAVVCLSVDPDGAALLPIDTRDADNQPGRPYACTQIMVRADNLVSFDPSRRPGGAREPE